MNRFGETFALDGCLRIDRLFDPSLIEAAHDEFQRQYGQLSADQLPAHLNVGDRRIQLPIELRGALADPMLSAHPLLLTILESVLGKDALIDSAVCVVALPGAADQLLHRDHHELFPGEAESGESLSAYAVTVAIPLIDLTPETGTTLLYAGSHRLKPGADRKPAELGRGEPAYVTRGGCYFMDYRLWHHGTANRSAGPRPVLYLIYARPWFTDEINFRGHQRINLRRETLMAMPLVQRRLFRRLAAKGTYDLTEQEMIGEAG